MNRLRELRKEHGLTLDDIEGVLGIGRSTYNNYENGKSFPKFKTLVKIAAFYDVGIDYMLGVEREPCAKESKHTILNRVACQAVGNFKN